MLALLSQLVSAVLHVALHFQGPLLHWTAVERRQLRFAVCLAVTEQTEWKLLATKLPEDLARRILVEAVKIQFQLEPHHPLVGLDRLPLHHHLACTTNTQQLSQ